MSEAIWYLFTIIGNALEAFLLLFLLNRKLGRGWLDWQKDAVYTGLVVTLLTVFSVLGLSYVFSLLFLLVTTLSYCYNFKNSAMFPAIRWLVTAHAVFFCGNYILSLWVERVPLLSWELLSAQSPIRLMMLLFYSLIITIAIILLAKPETNPAVIPQWMYPLLYVLAVGAVFISGILLDLSQLILVNPDLSIALTLSFCMLFIVIVSGFVLFDRLVYSTTQSIELQTRVMRSEAESKDLQNLLDGYENLRNLWHDIKQHFAILLGYAETDRYAEMKHYLVDVLHQDFIPVRDLLFSGHPHLDALLFVKAQQARRLGLELQKKLVVPQNLPFNESDFVAIIGNILDNAFEALEHLPQDRRFLRFDATIRKGMWVIEVQNASNGVYRQDKSGIFSSTKSGTMHGIGLRRIRELVERMGGLVEIDAAPSSFTITLHLPIPEVRDAEEARRPLKSTYSPIEEYILEEEKPC